MLRNYTVVPFLKFIKWVGSLGPERAFLGIFIFFGIIFVFAVPPFQNPDEPMHFYRAYQVSQGKIISEEQRGEQGGVIPLAMTEFVQEAGTANAYNYNYKFKRNTTHLLHYQYGGETVFESFPNTAIYSPLPYVPQAFAHKIIDILGLPMLLSVYLGRLFTLMIAAAAVLVAIRVIPFGKWILVAVGLMPMAIASATSLGADSVTMGTTILFVSYVINLAFSNKIISRKQILLLAALTISMALIKQSHIILALFLWIIPIFNTKARNLIYYRNAIILTFISVLVFALWYSLTNSAELTSDPLVDPQLQKEYVLSNPFNFLFNPFLQTFFTTNSNGLLGSLFGNFGWLSAPLPLIYIIVSVVMLSLATQIFEKNEINVEERRLIPKLRLLKGISLSFFLAVVGLTATTLYLYWTPYKYPTILGLQGRYLIPLLPMLLICFVGRGRKETIQQRRAAVLIGSTIVLTASVVVLYARFYVEAIPWGV